MRLRDLLKPREAPLIFTKSEAERSCAGEKSCLLSRAVQGPEHLMSVLIAEEARDVSYMADQKKDLSYMADQKKDLWYMADQKKDLSYMADQKVQSQGEVKAGLDEAQDSRWAIPKCLNRGAWTRTLEAGVKSGIEYREESRPALLSEEMGGIGLEGGSISAGGRLPRLGLEAGWTLRSRTSIRHSR